MIIISMIHSVTSLIWTNLTEPGDLDGYSDVYGFIGTDDCYAPTDMFEYQADDYSYNTRHIKDPKIQKFKKDIVRRSLLYKGPHNWFNLDADVKATTSKKAFMTKLYIVLSLSLCMHEYVFLCKCDNSD